MTEENTLFRKEIMAKINIKNLKLRTIIGIHDWEREHNQDVVINIEIHYDATKAAVSDRIQDTLDYKKITKAVIKLVESSRFQLIEKLASQILDLVLSEKKVKEATVRLDKPFALRFAESVSVELNKKRSR